MTRRKKHWIDELSDDLRDDMELWKEDIIEAFSDVAPIGGFKRTPPIEQRVKGYLDLTPQARQAMFLELGPEGYTNFVQKAVSDLVQVYGANASAAMSWFMGVGPEQPQGGPGISSEQSEADIITMLGTGTPPEEGI